MSEIQMSTKQNFMHKSRYARYVDEKERRETWEETVNRYCDFWVGKFGETFPRKKIFDAMYALNVLPSMRLLMTAGKAVERDNIAAYNCSYIAVNNKRAFSETLYILMCGTGVGFSCERQEISKLPQIPDELRKTENIIVVDDSKLGWAKAYKKYISSLFDGDIPQVDYTKLRAAGARLKTFGGRASGPGPLKELFEFTKDKFAGAVGRKLTSTEVHDLMCKIGEVVVVGGVRRSALISLSNLSDDRMRHAKIGAWWETEPQRALANNSAVYTEKPEIETFMEEWLSLIKSKSGERGIFSRVASQKQAAKYGFRSPEYSYGTNPCSEIILRDKQFCNLSTITVRATDTLEDLSRKIELATIIGTFQSTLTDFQFLSDEWKKNTEEERLLGVSMTGIMDHPVLNSVTPEAGRWLDELRELARVVNTEWAEKLEIKPSAAITCVKPEGSSTQLVDAGTGGLHPRYAEYYFRTIRQDNKDPLTHFMKDQGVYHEPDVMKPDNTTVFYFPEKSPANAVLRNDRTAIQQLDHWMMFQRHWCEHKPSVTIYVKEHEWLEVGAWVYKYFDEVSGISFLPHSDHSYRQAPFQEVTEQEYLDMLGKTPDIDWRDFIELDDNSSGAQTLACVAGNCLV